MGARSLSRRQFLLTTAGCGLLLSVAAPSLEAWLARLLAPAAAAGGMGGGVGGTLAGAGGGGSAGTAAAAPVGGTSLAELLRTAPVARYWASTGKGETVCATCHAPEELVRFGAAHAVPGSHDHGPPVVKCLLCARGCVLREGERGECGARLVSGGQLRSLVYGRPAAVHVDPIEKKPFYHFLPGSLAFSLATAGCPLHCQFCQNWELSQSRPEDHGADFTPPASIAAAAQRRRAPVVAFTYNEPTVFTEYLTDVARAARPLGLHSVLISCGFMTEAPLAEMCEVLDAIKIDLKGFDPGFYRQVTKSELAPVLRSIQQVARSGRHLELVNLVVPTLNDSDAMLRGLCEWVMGELGPDVPIHFTRFHPDYKLLNLPPTPVSTLEKARDLALRAGLRYAYVGNVPGHPGNHTYCPRCGKVVIRRDGLFVGENNLKDGACKFCGAKVAGVWS